MSRILVVEDNEMNRRLVRDVLGYSGHEVVEATTIEDALALVRTTLPELVLTDLRLPDGTGERVLFEVRGDPRVAHVPVVMVTASAMDGDRERLLSLGFDGYISKPISITAFERDVDAFLAVGARRRTRAEP